MPSSFLFFDLETTGLSITNDQITQIGASFCSARTFESFVKPTRTIHKQSSEKTGIYAHHVADADAFPLVWAKFLAWVEEEEKKEDAHIILVAYNGNGFDFPLLTNELKRYGLPLPSSWSLLDPLVWARRFVDESCLLRKNTGACSFVLNDVHCALFGSHIVKAHTALADTVALRKVCEHAEFKGCLHVDHCVSFRELHLQSKVVVVAEEEEEVNKKNKTRKSKKRSAPESLFVLLAKKPKHGN